MTKFVIFSTALGIIGIIATIIVVISWGHFNFSTDISFEKINSIGGFIGGLIGAFFSIVAVILLYYTYRTQKEELQKTIGIANEQSETLKVQQFESTFFNLIENLHLIIDNLRSNDINMSGNRYLEYLMKSFIDSMNNSFFSQLKAVTKNNGSKKELELLTQNISEEFDNFFKHRVDMGHFYRYLHNIFKHIDNAHIENKKKYFDLLQANFSNAVLAFILYNSISNESLNKEGEPVFRNYVDKYGILENIDKSYILNERLEQKFPNTEFYFNRNKTNG